MQYHSSPRNIVFTVFFSILAALALNSCGDTNNVSGPPEPAPLSPDALLSTLTVTPGALQPAFSSDVANYTVDVAFNEASVRVTAAPQDANATMTIDGQATTSGQPRTITLGAAGSITPIRIVVTAQNGSQNTYVVTVNRAVNNSLQSLTVTSSPAAGPLTPAFTASTTSYTVAVDSGVASVTVTATLQDTNATMTINGQATTSGQARTITPLNGPGSSTLVTIEVTAPNGSQKTYFVTVHRAALGGNNNLQSLTVTSSPTAGPLTPAFNASTTSYSVDVASGVGSVTVTARAQDAGATVSINGQTTTSRSVTLNAAGQSTLVTIEVTAPNLTQKTYTVLVHRAALGGNNNLQSLTVTSSPTAGPLTPAFNASTTSYSVDVASGVGSVTVTARAQDAGATVSINGQTTTSLLVTLNAAGQSTLVTIEVTAPNLTQKTYTVLVHRAALGGNNNLQSLTVTSSPTAGPLTPAFNASTTSYSVNVASGVGSVTVTAQAQDAGATVSINGQTTTSLLVTLNAAGQSTLVTIEVTAPNLTQKTYTVLVHRAALGGNNNLQSLTVTSSPTAGPLTPAFNASTTSYSVNVASGVGSVTVTAQAQDAGATVSINGQTTTSLLVTLNAAGQSTLVTIEVTAPNGNQKTYTVTVNRAAIVLSGNNNLSALAVSAEALVPVFDAATTSYNVAAPIGTVDTTVTATVEDSTATLTINNLPATSGAPSASIPLVGGLNSIPIVVTAENGTTKTYTVIITVP